MGIRQEKILGFFSICEQHDEDNNVCLSILKLPLNSPDLPLVVSMGIGLSAKSPTAITPAERFYRQNYNNPLLTASLLTGLLVPCSVTQRQNILLHQVSRGKKDPVPRRKVVQCRVLINPYGPGEIRKV